MLLSRSSLSITTEVDSSLSITTEVDAQNRRDAEALIKRQYSPYYIRRIEEIKESCKSEPQKSKSTAAKILQGFLFLGFLVFVIATEKNHESTKNVDVANEASSLDKPSSTIASGSQAGQDSPEKTMPPKFLEGQSSRRKWETWIATLTGDERKGAEYWAGERSKPAPDGCDGTLEFSHGCFEAQRRLFDVDKARHSDPDFRQGWNTP